MIDTALQNDSFKPASLQTSTRLTLERINQALGCLLMFLPYKTKAIPRVTIHLDHDRKRGPGESLALDTAHAEMCTLRMLECNLYLFLEVKNSRPVRKDLAFARVNEPLQTNKTVVEETPNPRSNSPKIIQTVTVVFTFLRTQILQPGFGALFWYPWNRCPKV